MKNCVTCCHQGGKWKHLFLWEPSPLMMQAKHTKHASKCADRHKRTLTHTNVLHHTNAHCQQFQHTCIEYIYENLYIACLRVTARQSTTERDGSEKKRVHGCQNHDQMAKCQWIPHQHDSYFSLTERVHTATQLHLLIQWASELRLHFRASKK